MCGRYVRKGDKQKLAEHLHAQPNPAELAMADADYNVAPTSHQPIIRQSRESGEREMMLARWGLIPFFTKDLSEIRGLSTINTRAESITQASTWREPMKNDAASSQGKRPSVSRTSAARQAQTRGPRLVRQQLPIARVEGSTLGEIVRGKLRFHVLSPRPEAYAPVAKLVSSANHKRPAHSGQRVSRKYLAKALRSAIYLAKVRRATSRKSATPASRQKING